MEKAIIDNRRECVSVDFGDKTNGGLFSFLWLRDNCQCNKCYHSDSKARIFLMRYLQPDTTPNEVKLVTPETLKVTWTDGHVSSYTSDWLRDHGINNETRDRVKQLYRLPSKLWTADMMQDKIPVFDFNELLENDASCLRWLTILEQDGICVVTGAPQKQGTIHHLCNRIAYPRKSAYGETFQVYSKHNAQNVAYTSGTLGFHTDQAYLNYIPGMQMLHCIKKANQGGENIFSDGFKVALDMRENYPEDYKILCTTPMYFVDVGEQDGKGFHTMNHGCTFELNGEGELERINFSTHSRFPKMGLEPEACQALYKAMIRFESLLMEPKYCITYLLQPGEIACFHNYRVLHGREKYTMTGSDERHLEGGYIDWDEMRSMRRVLNAQAQSQNGSGPVQNGK